MRFNCLRLADYLALLTVSVFNTRKQVIDLEQMANKVGLQILYKKP